MTDPRTEHIKAHREYFREVLLKIKKIMADDFGMLNASIRPISVGGARLSIPVKMEGVDKDGRPLRYFGKIVGSTDMLTARTVHFFKNVYLQMNGVEPLFKITESPEAMVKYLYEMAKQIDQLGIPTAKPIGYRQINPDLWLMVSEFLDAGQMVPENELNARYVDAVFGYLKKMHTHGIFHGDMKSENILVGEKVYIVDVGHFIESAPSAKKQAYDVASEMACFVEYVPAQEIVRLAKKRYTMKELRQAAKFLDLVQRRPDLYLSDDNKLQLQRLLK